MSFNALLSGGVRPLLATVIIPLKILDSSTVKGMESSTTHCENDSLNSAFTSNNFGKCSMIDFF